MAWRYLPDAPPDTPDTWRVCDGFHPDRNGIYRTGFQAASYSDYGSGVCSSGRAYRTAAGAIGIVVFQPILTGGPSAGHAYVWDGSSWNDRFNSTSNKIYVPEQIVQFGNLTYVGNSGTGIYSRDATGSSNFASVAGSPSNVSVLLLTPLNIMVALAGAVPQAGGSTAAASDGWYTSDANDPTNWSTGQAASGNLRQTKWPITAGVVFGNDVIVFKRTGVYRGQYVGLANQKWQWSLIDPSLGAWGPGAAITAAGKVYFYGDNGFYSFDGANFQKLDIGVGSAIASTIGDPSGAFDDDNYVALRLVYDSLNRRIAMFNFGAIATGIGQPTAYQMQHFTYQIDCGQFGYQSRSDDNSSNDNYTGVVLGAEELNSFSNGGWLYNSNIALLSQTNTRIDILTTEFASANCGTNYQPRLRTHRIGSRLAITNVVGVVPNWTVSDNAGTDLTGATLKTITPQASDSLMEGETAQTAVTMTTDQYRADFTKSSRWLSAEIKINCEACIDGVTWDNPKYAGKN